MTGFILGKKISQSQSFTEDGRRISHTTIKTSPCYLIDVKTKDKQGYFAIKLGVGIEKKIKKPVQGELNKVGIKTPLSFLREIRLERFKDAISYIEEDGKKGLKINDKKIFIGEEVTPDLLFNVGDLVDVSGVSKGKGFQGVVKRHHFAGGPRTHGQSDRERAPGSIGQTTTPGRVYKGKRMAGRMGGERVTIKNLSIIKIDKEGITVKGLVPGAVDSWLEIKTLN
jgi:large subunit ribosomal protein L3